MAREMTGLKFYFRNGETWTIDRRFIGDLWIKHITTSFVNNISILTAFLFFFLFNCILQNL